MNINEVKLTEVSILNMIYIMIVNLQDFVNFDLTMTHIINYK